MSQLEKLVSAIAKLPEDWHEAGTMDEAVLRAILRYAPEQRVSCSAETGAGKTTLLFSHLSLDHKVFAKQGGNHSITVVRESSLLSRSTVEFIEGPTQVTLSAYTFQRKLDMVLLDGPHGYPFPELEYYYLYPHLDTNALLIVDDIHIPTIRRLFDFLKEDDMFRLIDVVDKTAFFRRTDAPLFDPQGDGWWQQAFNKKRFPVGAKVSALRSLRRFVALRLPRIVHYERRSDLQA